VKGAKKSLIFSEKKVEEIFDFKIILKPTKEQTIKIGENKWQDWLGLIYPVTKEWL